MCVYFSFGIIISVFYQPLPALLSPPACRGALSAPPELRVGALDLSTLCTGWRAA